MKINFSPPYVDDYVIGEVIDTLKSGWITTGPKVEALEKKIKSYVGAQAVLCVNSWTSGAILMLKWLGVKEGDEVIIPAYTYSATALAVMHAGATPVMVDSNEDFNISVEAIKKAITSKTKAIIPVDIAGYPCDYDEIMNLVCQQSIIDIYEPTSNVQKDLGRIIVINDAAHSLGATYKRDLKTGSETDIAIFSLHAVKNITTAEGGAICLNLPHPFDNSSLYAELRRMTLNCQTKDALSKSKAGSWKYDIVGFGMKINLPDINAAIGLAQLRQYSKLLADRKSVFERYNDAFSKYDWAILPPCKKDEKETSYHLYALRIKNFSEEQRNTMITEIALNHVAVNVHFIPLPMLSFFKSKGYKIEDYPKAYENYSVEISLPIYPQLSEDEIDYVVEIVSKGYEKAKWLK